MLDFIQKTEVFIDHVLKIVYSLQVVRASNLKAPLSKRLRPLALSIYLLKFLCKMKIVLSNCFRMLFLKPLLLGMKLLSKNDRDLWRGDVYCWFDVSHLLEVNFLLQFPFLSHWFALKVIGLDFHNY